MMASRYSLESLVESLQRQGYIRSPYVASAFLSVPRDAFVPEAYKDESFQDTPLPIGYGQTISAPSMIAIMLEAANLAPGMMTLEIGTGSGYNACLLARIVGNTLVKTIERIPQLHERAASLLSKHAPGVEAICGDGTTGLERFAPYERILITAAAPAFPAPLLGQLAVGGRILAPLGAEYGPQVLMVGTKSPDGTLHTERGTWCRFVPLIGKHGFKEEMN
jgi:protein-L-isoaspartate(D-aspartate) O-methyltransferase